MADGDLYEPRTIAESVTPATATLASIADAHRLMICIGAGFSMAAPTFLPAGKKLANEVHARLAAKLPHVPECDPDNLVSVADAVEPLETGSDLIRRTCLEAADFLTAAPNHAHKLLALLLLEGEVSAMSWNWDNCIERCGRGEELLTIIRDEDRIYAQGSPLLKLHGCANHPTTMLVSTSDLDEPRPWVDAELAGRLADSVVVFVGVGDVVGYTKRRVSEIKETLGNPDHIFVVSPGIVDGWESSAWAEVLDGLPADNRIADTAEAFLESLAASMIMGLLLKVCDSAGEYGPLKAGANAVKRAVEDSAPHLVLSLGRFSRVRAKPGFRNVSRGMRQLLMRIG
ncbi:MAG: hypothetical protein OSA99_21315 [Acidimicrobiales bacterium]|nr:hypothetical protein [Acidimicrobiales bacterium]